jgi:hypothetical protein
MDQKRNKLPLKLMLGIVAMFIVFAFSMTLTSKTSAQQAATDTPTATPTMMLTPGATSTPEAASPTSTPDTGATQAPSTGSTGSIPVTGSNQASSFARALAFSKAATRLSNVSDNNLEDTYSELLSRLQKEQRMINSANNKLNQFTRQLGKNAFNNNNAQNQNGLSVSEMRSKRVQAIQKDFLTFSRNLAVARQQVLLAQIALNSSAGFNTEGSLANRQAAINALALAQISLDRGMAALKQIENVGEINTSE